LAENLRNETFKHLRKAVVKGNPQKSLTLKDVETFSPPIMYSVISSKVDKAKEDAVVKGNPQKG